MVFFRSAPIIRSRHDAPCRGSDSCGLTHCPIETVSRLPHRSRNMTPARTGARRRYLIVQSQLRGAMPSLELPHWPMIAGALLAAAGFLGLAFGRKREVTDPQPTLEPPKKAASSPIVRPIAARKWTSAAAKTENTGATSSEQKRDAPA
jgi:hypothetical protein